MDSNTTAGGGIPLLHLDPSALLHLVMLAGVVCVIAVVIILMAFVINYFRGPKEGLDQEAGCFPDGDGDGDGGRAPRQQQPVAVAGAEVAIAVAGEDDAVPTVIICKTDGGGGQQEPTCAVCQEELAGGGALRALSPCRHCFHSACARELVRLHAICPLCQSPVAAGATV